jgi:hypothetical protein
MDQSGGNTSLPSTNFSNGHYRLVQVALKPVVLSPLHVTGSVRPLLEPGLCPWTMFSYFFTY